MQLGHISRAVSRARGFNYHYPALARVLSSHYGNFPAPCANSDRKCKRRGGGRSLQPAIPALVPRPRVSPLFLSPLSSPIVGRELEVRERSDDREFPRGIVTKLLTASRPTRARRCRGFSQVSRYRRRHHPRHALSGCACQLPKNKINYGTPVFMPREGGRTRGAGESTGRERRKEKGVGSGVAIRGAHRRDYRTKLRTKVIRPWRRGRVFGITGGLCAAGFIFLHCEIMDWDRANALLSSLCPLLAAFIDMAFAIILCSHPDDAPNYQFISHCNSFSEFSLLTLQLRDKISVSEKLKITSRGIVLIKFSNLRQ